MVDAPAAEGKRLDWSELPSSVQAAVAEVCGSAVGSAATQRAGFSPGVAARLGCADGSRWFVKAVPHAVNEESVALHRREAAVLRTLEPLAAAGLAVTRLVGLVDQDGWTALVLTDLDGRHPTLPWDPTELEAVVAAVDEMLDRLTPAPATTDGTSIDTIAERFGRAFTGWRTLAGGPLPAALDHWTVDHLDQLATLEAGWEPAAAGDSLLHCDLRADNLLVVDDRVFVGERVFVDERVFVVDWPHACRGAAFVDLVLFAPSVAMQHGPDPQELLAMSRHGRPLPADRDRLAPVVCAFAGTLTQRSLLPPPPGLPTLRAFQAAQAVAARAWLAALL